MIKITDSSVDVKGNFLYKRTAGNGALVLDRVAITMASFELAENKAGSPSANFLATYGIENSSGEFDAIEHESTLFNRPIRVEPASFELFVNGTKEQPPGGTANPMNKGMQFIEALTLWVEQILIAQGDFGVGAVIIRQKRRVFIV